MEVTFETFDVFSPKRVDDPGYDPFIKLMSRCEVLTCPGCQDRGGGDRDDRDAHLALVLRPLLSQVSTCRQINQLLFNYLSQVAQLSPVISFCT